jgi:hypothetical protein
MTIIMLVLLGALAPFLLLYGGLILFLAFPIWVGAHYARPYLDRITWNPKVVKGVICALSLIAWAYMLVGS